MRNVNQILEEEKQIFSVTQQMWKLKAKSLWADDVKKLAWNALKLGAED